jgi:hypothetical protein
MEADLKARTWEYAVVAVIPPIDFEICNLLVHAISSFRRKPTAVRRKFTNLACELHNTSPSFRRKPESIVVGAENLSNSTTGQVRKMDSGLRRNDGMAEVSMLLIFSLSARETPQTPAEAQTY